LSLVAALGRCAELLEKFGGHEMAAGLTIREESLQIL
jgi:single-stranded-DNA-specific exonuclease